jgi:hypothetical protein
MRWPLVIYDFTTAPFWISSQMKKILFSFLSVYLCWQVFRERVVCDDEDDGLDHLSRPHRRLFPHRRTDPSDAGKGGGGHVIPHATQW